MFELVQVMEKDFRDLWITNPQDSAVSPESTGVAARSLATPRSATPFTAESWGFVIQRSRKSFSITWTNSNTENGFPVAIMLQYGHGTGTGGWVRGRDYINPAIQPIIDEIAEDLWKVVTSA